MDSIITTYTRTACSRVVIMMTVRHLCLMLITLALSFVTAADAAEPDTAAYAAAVGELPSASFPRKAEILEQLLVIRHPNTRELLAALLEDRLYGVSAADTSGGGTVVIVAPGQDEAAETFAAIDAVTLDPAGTVNRGDYRRITTNNQLRRSLRGAIARFALTNDDPEVRIAAVREMLRSIDDDGVALLRERREEETDAAVRTQIDVALAMADLANDDPEERLRAVRTLDGQLHADVYNRLKTIAEPAEDGTYAEADVRVRMAAAEVVRSIEASRSFYSVLENLFFGLSLGSVLVLAAIGLAITFGVMGVINMAHGEMMMLGAYTTYVIQLLMPQSLGISILLAIPAAFVVGGLAGIAIERGVVRFLYGRPLETLLATFGVSLVLQQLVRSVFSPLNVAVSTPGWMSGSLVINDAFSITYNRLYIVLFTLIVFIILQLVMRRTTLGLKVRAVAQNRSMAKAMGVRTEWIDAVTFGLGSGIAGVAGVALSQLTNVGPNLGQSYIIDSFMVVVFGGVGNLWGTLISGLSLGAANKFLEPYAGAVLAKILVLIFLIIFIQRKPRGLFPQKGRAAEH